MVRNDLGTRDTELSPLKRDAGLALTAYLDGIITRQTPCSAELGQIFSARAQDKLRILELGSGSGIVGVGLAQMLPTCQVFLTDLQEAAEIIRRNIDASSPAAASTLNFSLLDWEEPIPDVFASQQFDLIVVSDCTYNSDSIPALVRILADLVKLSPEAVIVISLKVRHSSEQIFFELMAGCGLDITGQATVNLPVTQQQPDDLGEPDTVYISVFRRRT